MDNSIILRAMKPGDYYQVRELWESIRGFAIRSIDDSRENIIRFLVRNEGISCVAYDKKDNSIVGAILCGHDGRTATFYHVCVAEEYRRRGIGKEMVSFCMKKLIEEQINTISLVAFTSNDVGNRFWHSIGWEKRSDVHQYRFRLNEKNVIAFTQ